MMIALWIFRFLKLYNIKVNLLIKSQVLQNIIQYCIMTDDKYF
jgi:hypothetical protein